MTAAISAPTRQRQGQDLHQYRLCPDGQPLRYAGRDPLTAPGPTSDSLITTFNLSNYSASDQIWLDFYYQNQGITFSLPGNQVWIRGNDQSAWIPVYTLDTNAANIGIYQPSPHINVTGILQAASQTLSSSFQIKFGEEGYTSTNDVIPDGNLNNGYSFDDITLTRATNDIGHVALVAPDTVEPLLAFQRRDRSVSSREKLQLYSTATNIPVTYSINGATVTETIPSIGAGDSIIYTFTQTADLSAWQAYTITALGPLSRRYLSRQRYPFPGQLPDHAAHFHLPLPGRLRKQQRLLVYGRASTAAGNGAPRKRPSSTEPPMASIAG